MHKKRFQPLLILYISVPNGVRKYFGCFCSGRSEDYQSGVYNVTVVAEQISAEVSIAIFDDSIVKVNETFTAVLSVPAAECVS